MPATARLRILLLAGAALTAAGLARPGPALAKTLVYCSEGSPENFNPMLNTTGTTFDANRPIYNRLVEFKIGTTDLLPGLAESWDVSPDGKTFTFHLRHGVKWHSNATFTPTRDFQCRRRAVLVQPPGQRGQPVPQGVRRRVFVLRRHGLHQAHRLDR